MLTDVLKNALVTQVSCGDEALRQLLLSEIDLVYACLVADGVACSERLKYLYVQMALIEIAQLYARNKIDTHTRTAVARTDENYSALAVRNTNAESTATGRSCNWATATSQQYFTRTSTDDSVFWSESNLLRTAERTEDGFDRSRRSTSGSGFSRSLVLHTVEDRGGNAFFGGLGTESRQSRRISNTSGGTSDLVPLTGITWDYIPEVSFNDPYIIVGQPGPLLAIPKPGSSEQVCPEPDPNDPDKRLCSTEFFPSMGQGYHGRRSFSIVVPPIGQLTLTWEDAFNERQYYHCSGSTVEGDSEIHGRQSALNVAQTIAFPANNASGSSETSSTIHFVRKNGTSTRRGEETIDAEERQRGYADGDAHHESARDIKGQAKSERRSESLTTGAGESHLRRTETANDEELRRSYGQISTALGNLWKRIWDHIQLLERELGSIPYAGSMCCPPAQLGCKGCFNGSFLSRRYLSRSPFITIQDW